MSKEKEFDIHKYLDIFHKFKWHALVPAVGVMIAMGVASLYLPKVYESSCTVEVDTGSIENPLRSTRGQRTGFQEQLRTFSENALKWEVLSHVANEVGVDAITENSDIYNLQKLKRRIGLAKKAPRSSQQDSALEEATINILRRSITFTHKRPRFLVISYRGTRSDVNSKVLNTLVTTLIEEKEKWELSQAGRSYEFLKSEMNNYREKLEEAESQLKEFKEDHGSELPNNVNINLRQLTDDKSDLLACELEVKELSARLRFINQELEQKSELIVSEVRRETNPMLVVLNERIVDMEVELTRLRTNYTELHPRIIELRGQLEDLKKQREEVEESTVDSETSMLNPVYQRLMEDKQNTLVRMEVLDNRIANLNVRIARNEEIVKNVPAQEQELLTLTRNYEVTSRIYNMFVQKLEEAKIQEKLATEEMGRESFNVLQYARATFTPVAPKRMRILAVILMIGFGTGLGIIVLLDFLDDSLGSIEEAKEVIERPLLGTVPSLKDGRTNGSVRKLLVKSSRKTAD